MSERAPQPSPESMPKRVESSPERQNNVTRKHEKQPSNAEKQENISALRQEVSKEAHQSGDLKLDNLGEQKSPVATTPVNRELKNMMRIRTLKRIQKELPASQRTLSKIIHTKPVEVLSTAGEKTIARPAGLLGGGLLALIGSIVTLYTAKHYGFRYNLLLFFMLFVLGYLVATLLELIIRIIQRARR